MAKKYTHLKIQERSVLMIMRADACPMREIARFLGRSASSTAKKMPKLDKDSDLFKGAHEKLTLLWSPQQIASALKAQ